MAIFREVETKVYCDICGGYIIGWKSAGTGVSKGWATYFAREEGATVGKKVKCKECRIRERIEKCSLIKKCGSPGIDNGICMGFRKEFDDRHIEKCKQCIACIAYKLSIDGKKGDKENG